MIVPTGTQALEKYGLAKIFSPGAGRRIGPDGMIAAIIDACDFSSTDGRTDLASARPAPATLS